MPEPGPAAELRAATTTLRARAATVSRPPWMSDHSIPYGHRVGPEDGTDWVAWTGEHGESTAAEHADFIALMDPAVAGAVADWLDAVGGDVGDHSECIGKARCELASALRVARQINSKEQP